MVSSKLLGGILLLSTGRKCIGVLYVKCGCGQDWHGGRTDRSRYDPLTIELAGLLLN